MQLDTSLPGLERFGPIILAGHMREHRLTENVAEMYRAISAQWRELAEVAHAIPVLAPRLGHGVALGWRAQGEHIGYFAGFAVPTFERVPPGFDGLEIPLLTCAVFQHQAHVSQMRATIDHVFRTVLPLAGLEPAGLASGAPDFIQRYCEGFDPETGLGGLEVLVPVKEYSV